ncbi:glucose 1-dehydrogenase [Noviherbaspirillum sp. ST9]|uniref:glucose 1-dehydrogenase n=1 Tax=Noviherbaspirillum sp. ST9 TaxID=3401606 RepID=UPI003B58B41E
MQDDFRLDGKTVLVTGGARGIGAECARVMADAGAAVMVTDVLSDVGRKTAGDIRERGGKAAYLDLDVTSDSAWQSCIDATLSTFGGLDGLVNNAGLGIMDYLGDSSIEDFRRMMAVNGEGVFLGMKHAVEVMRPGGKAGRGGSIVNISSLAGIVGFPGISAYGASKGAVRIMSKDVAVECGKLGYGIRCNSVHPAVIETDMGDIFIEENARLAGASIDEIRKVLKAMHPLGRFGSVRDIANAVRFLCSDASAWITGIELAVDGGFSAT